MIEVGVPGLGDQATDVHDLAVGRVDLQQQVLDDDRESERDEQSRKWVAVDTLLNESPLEHIADQREEWHDDQEGPQLGYVQVRGQEDRDVARHDGHVAVGEVDDLEDPEHER